MYRENHYIFKLFDGKNFFDFDNLSITKKISNQANNSFSIDGIDYESSLAIYYRIE